MNDPRFGSTTEEVLVQILIRERYEALVASEKMKDMLEPLNYARDDMLMDLDAAHTSNPMDLNRLLNDFDDANFLHDVLGIRAKLDRNTGKLTDFFSPRCSLDEKQIKERLEYLRGELRAERISYGELAELQSLVEHIDKDDVELLEAAGVPEFS